MLEVNAPANRGDVLGHLGVARELVRVLRGKLVLPDVDLSAYQGGAAPKVEIAIAGSPTRARATSRA